MYEGTPDFPDQDRWWEIVERYKVDILYTAPTAIRTYMKWGPEYAQQARSFVAAAARHGRRADQSRGVDLVPRHIGGGRCPIVDTWWQTETGMILITPLPGITTTKPGSATRARSSASMRRSSTRQGNEVGPGGRRYLVAQAAVAGDAARDLGRRRALPRDVLVARSATSTSPATARASTRTATSGSSGASTTCMNVSGHRISTIEIESRARRPPRVAEAASCGRKDALTGQAIVAFVTLKARRRGSLETLEELRDHVAQEDRPVARPATSASPPGCRRRAAARSCAASCATSPNDRPLGDTTTLADLRRRGQ